MQTSYYWSFSTSASSLGNAIGVSFYIGREALNPKTLDYTVWPVRYAQLLFCALTIGVALAPRPRDAIQGYSHLMVHYNQFV